MEAERVRRWLGPLSAATLFATTLSGQTDWENRSPNPQPRFGHTLAFDLLRGRTLLFGGWSGPPIADTWESDGTIWNRRASANTPAARGAHALAYDLARGRIVLFGGATVNSVQLADTWEWDGADWTQRFPAQSPPARSNHALASDIIRNRTVLFGGQSVVGSVVLLADTWEWDGVNWLQRAPASSPPGRCGHALAFDLLRGRTVLFGGLRTVAPIVMLADTWEWDGTNWLPFTPAQSPPARFEHTLAFDVLRGQAVLFGGADASVRFADTWEWDGTNWVQRMPAASPPPQQFSGMAYDLPRACTVLFSGEEQGGAARGDTWEWNGSNWTQRAPSPVPPPRNAASVYDPIRSRTVLFGGQGVVGSNVVMFADTWEWDGVHWLQRATASSPPGRCSHALAFDSQRGRTLLFGGLDSQFTSIGDTWQWDGSIWTQLASVTSPAARSAHALAYDSVRDRVVLFGGVSVAFGPVFGDTWEWDGGNWTQRVPAQSPPARQQTALAFDRARGRTVLFGGAPSSNVVGTIFADTWEWDGTNWSPAGSANAPPRRLEHALAYDAARGRTVLFGGFGGANGSYVELQDTWEWDGIDWTQRATASSPPGRRGHVLAFDAARGRTVLFGSSSFTDTWEYGPVTPGTWVPFGTGCAGSAGVPVLAGVSELRPYPGNNLTVEVAPVPANTAAVFSLGLSRTQWSGLSLPLPLDNLGMPGCALFASDDASMLRFAAGSVASLTIPIPNNQVFVGLTFYTQAFALDPSANAAGATASNAAAATIGSK
jgi:hypothetical protein